MSKTKTVRRGTGDIAVAMRARYPANAWALLFEVGDGTGMNCSRHVDAIAMSLWPSRGLDVYGFEFKISRGDWVKERDNPAKAEAILQYCDYFSLVVTNADIVQPGELPEKWGLIELQGKDTLRTKREPMRLISKPLTRDFVAAVLRRAAEPIAAADANALHKARAAGEADERERSARTTERLTKEIVDMKRAIASFENTTGIRISDRWSQTTPEKLVAAIAALADAEYVADQLKHAKRDAERIAAEFGNALAGIAALKKGPDKQ